MTGPKAERDSRRAVWTIGLVLVAAAAIVTGYRVLRNPGEPAARSGPGALSGRWERPDGGYVLELGEAGPDGSLGAAYFNPGRVKVSRAEWRVEDGWLRVFVELRDVNYPGSTYTLTYDPVLDELLGVYYQAATQRSFEVRFARAR